MDNTKANNLITKKDLDNLADRLEKSFDEKFEKRFTESEKKFNERFKESEKNFDIKLGQFTEDVLLPSITEIISAKIGKYNHDIKVYIDSKTADSKGEIISYIKAKEKNDREWKEKVTDVLERHKLARHDELQRLCELNPINKYNLI